LESIAKFIHKLLDEVPQQLQAQKIEITLPPSPSRSTRTTYTQQEIAPCPACKQGTIIARKEFYGCSAYKSGCKQTFPSVFLKKKLTPNQVKLLCTKGKTNVIKGFTA